MSETRIRAPRGTKDVLPSEVYKWNYVENLFRSVCNRFGYKEIRTPIFEETRLFQRGVGETTDIVQKEMYSFKDNGGREITLKPEGTAPVVRSFIENKLYSEPQPTKLFYVTPCFRYERPQAGRLRAFHQFGIEVFGTDDPSVDAEVISVAMCFFNELGLKDLELRINSIGCPDCRKRYNQVLKEYLKEKLPNLCDTCKDRYERNPMRVIDCKVESCKKELKDIPWMLDYICDTCKEDFEKLKESLSLMGIDYLVDPSIVRGLDYYTKTAFEIVSNKIGAQGTVCGGGRYDGLIEELGGPPTPGVGFGMGIERLLLTLDNNEISIPKPKALDVFIIAAEENSRKEATRLLYQLREKGFSADKDYMNKSMKAQFKTADRLNAAYAIIVGEDELRRNAVLIKDMRTGEQTEVALNDISVKLSDMLKSQNNE
ncbi:MAG TPA: histidine--tRNA ligase [Clostridiales bacterium]|nr:histidine--tRNA ligase [Clostridiales bacterium]